MSEGNSEQTFYSAWRFYLVLFILFLIVSGLLWRIVDLAIFDQRFLQQQGNDRVLRLVSTPAFRGMIIDRNGFPLAVSTTVYSAWINPKEFIPSKDMTSSLSQILGMKDKEMTGMLKHYQKTKREFIYLKRGLPPEVAK